MANQLTPEEIAAADRQEWQDSIFDAQAYLMTFADRLWRTNANQRVLNNNLIRKNFPRIRVAQTQDPESLINRVTVNRDILNFLDGDSSDYTQLVPHIALYKVFVNASAAENVEVLYPFDNSTDFSFLDPISVHRQGPLQAGQGYAPSDFSMMGPSAGIKNVSWKMEGRGRNPFSANILEITVKMFFQDVKTLFRPLPLDTETKDKIAQAVNSQDFKMSYSDLIRYSPTLKNRASQTPGEREALKESISHRIRLELGWNINGEDNPIFEGREETFVKAVQNTKINILADLTEHNINFKENGSVELVIRYRGSISNVMSHMDLLEPIIEEAGNQFANQTNKLLDEIKTQGTAALATGTAEIQRGRQQKFQALRAAVGALKRAAVGSGHNIDFMQLLQERGLLQINADRSIIHIAPRRDLQAFAEGFNTSRNLQRTTRIFGAANEVAIAVEEYNNVRASAQRRANEARTNQAAAQRQLQNLRSNIQSFSIFSVFTKMIESNTVYSIELNAAQKTFWSQFLDLQNIQSQPDVQDRIRDFGSQTLPTAGAEQRSEFDLYFNGLNNVFRPPSQPGIQPSTPELTTDKTVSADTVKSEVLFATSNWRKDGMIYYVFLGDLLNTILENGDLGETISDHLPGFKFILGPMKFTHPLFPVEQSAGIPSDASGVINYRAGVNKSLINLFWLPIHLEVFMTFLTDKVIASGRKSYSLMLFIEDLVKFVMEKVTYSNRLSATTPNRVSLDTIPVNINNTLLENDFPTVPPTPGRFRGGTLLSRPITLNFDNSAQAQELAVQRASTSVVQRSMAPVWFITGQDISAESRSEGYRGRIAEDITKGIYHFSAGGMNRGILKAIEFNEIKQPYLAEATYRAAVGTGALQKEGVILPKKISVRLKLVGNPFFSIGQLFYISTKLVDGGYFIKEQLGFGGYYYITSVETEYGIGTYETIVEGILMLAAHLAAENSSGVIDHIYDWQEQTTSQLTAIDAARRRNRGGS